MSRYVQIQESDKIPVHIILLSNPKHDLRNIIRYPTHRQFESKTFVDRELFQNEGIIDGLWRENTEMQSREGHVIGSLLKPPHTATKQI